ncbi:MAG: glutathione S-transferase family protein, partial [Microvirga sp.]
MITLYGSGPNFGLPDASPFVTKAETLLRMSKLPFEKALMSFSKAPKGKIPYIEDDGQLLGDSTLIRWHLEKKYGIDFDQGLTAEQLAIAWAFEKMAEDSLYWASVYFRWMIEDNFRKGPVNFFKGVPAPVRPVVVSMIRRRLRKTLHGQGIGRHSTDEITAIGIRSIDAMAAYLGDKPFFMGSEPTGVDATMFAFMCGLLSPHFETRTRAVAVRHDNLRRYVGRMTARF